MWKETPPPAQLRKEFPDVALDLETSFVKLALDCLGLKYSVATQSKQKHILLPLNEGFMIRISPVDKGMHGYGEFLSWYMPNSHDEQELRIPTPTIRAFVQLIKHQGGRREVIYSFTDHQENIEQLIRSSLNAIFHVTGKKLQPIMRSKNNRSER